MEKFIIKNKKSGNYWCKECLDVYGDANNAHQFTKKELPKNKKLLALIDIIGIESKATPKKKPKTQAQAKAKEKNGVLKMKNPPAPPRRQPKLKPSLDVMWKEIQRKDEDKKQAELEKKVYYEGFKIGSILGLAVGLFVAFMIFIIK